MKNGTQVKYNYLNCFTYVKCLSKCTWLHYTTAFNTCLKQRCDTVNPKYCFCLIRSEKIHSCKVQVQVVKYTIVVLKKGKLFYQNKKPNHLIYAAAPEVLQVQPDCNVVHVWRWRVCVLIPQPHHQEVITWNFCEFDQLQALQAVLRFTHCSGFIF